MHSTNLRKVGGSIMLAIPPALLDVLQLQVGATVGIAVDGGRLVIEPQRRLRYTLEDLLSRCEPDLAPSIEEREWLDAPTTGDEQL